MKVVVGGNNKLSCDILSWLILNREDVVGIVAEGKDMTKRDVLWEKPFLPYAQEMSEKYGIPLFVGNISGFADELSELKPDIISPCRHKGLVKKCILDIPKIKDRGTGINACTNLHYGSLPRYGGMSPGYWAIQNEESNTGVTLQYMGVEFDEGPILDQRIFSLNEGERVLKLPDREVVVNGLTDFEIYDKSNKLAFQMYKDNYAWLASGEPILEEQDLSQKLYYNIGQTDEAKSKIPELDEISDHEIGKYVRSKYFPFFGYPRALYKGKEVELKLTDE